MDIFDEIRKMHREIDNVFSRFLESSNKIFHKEGFKENFREPLTNMKETDKEIIVEMEIPGVKKEEIILQVNKDVLEIRAKKESEIKVSKKGYSRHEKSFSGFYRKFALPTNVKVEEAQSEFKNGILKIRLPKSKEKVLRKIQIK